ncbi:DUF2589 domain-containing protein [Azospirillum canadense]|uniref:DUF2589 domain-containing protein n=1 Tax=Azospirillum canadense TaxID=403962 RepID=UPI002227D59B|nr:DUF2589 domain-containing protein [Azospirillum canadense]MCW2240025.1 hypothetical protein [Azospirillum canadense]
MSGLTLHDLIQSIAGAVADAQDKVQRFQIATVRQYFDENNRPVSVDVRLPSLDIDAEPEDERLVHVPLLSLVGPQLLNIKDVEIQFDVALNGLADKAPSDGDGEGPVEGAHKSLSVDMGAPRDRGAGSMARVTLKVESQEPSDGMARLIQHLDKQI